MKRIYETNDMMDTTPKTYTGPPKVDLKTGKPLCANGKEPDEEGNCVKDSDNHTPVLPGENDKPNINVQAEGYNNMIVKYVAKDGQSTCSCGQDKPLKECLKEFYDKTMTEGGYLIWENEETNELGEVTPVMFLKMYSAALLEADKPKEEPIIVQGVLVQEEKKANPFLANELMTVGLVNNVKNSDGKRLSESNPMKKAMEIYYSSKNSVIKEAKPVNINYKMNKQDVIQEKEVEVKPEVKKKNPIIW